MAQSRGTCSTSWHAYKLRSVSSCNYKQRYLSMWILPDDSLRTKTSLIKQQVADSVQDILFFHSQEFLIQQPQIKLYFLHFTGVGWTL